IPDNSDYIILLAAEHRDDVSPISLYYDVNVEGTHNVLRVMAEKNIEHIIFTSSVSVYGLNKKDPDELSGTDPFNHYGKSKLEAEKVLRRWFDNDRNGKSLIIVRPTVTFGPGNKGNVYNLLKQIASGNFIMVGKGRNKKSMAYVENVAGFISYCLDKKFKGYHLFNYIDKPDLSTKELVHIAEEALGKKLPPIRIPYFIGYTGGLTLDLISRITKKKFPISAVRVKKFCATTQFSSATIQATNYTPKKQLSEGLSITIKSIVNGSK
ncbi:MAG TPA: NAD-dependent epimerase/dehydratase family protein, partial [Chitinophagaceae bacterium]|nr:NAD-dependent epimerase/dehydratase family protein [Chitinophagaceae bacterium]